MKVALVGDSTTWGFPYGEEASWVTVLQREFIHHEWWNLGQNGDTFEGMKSRIGREVIVPGADLCVLTSGINDAFGDYSMPELETYLKEIHKMLSSREIQLVLGMPININTVGWGVDEKFLRIQKIIESYALENKLFMLDFRGLGQGDYSDEVHPSRNGYQKMAKKAVTFFKANSEILNKNQI